MPPMVAGWSWTAKALGQGGQRQRRAGGTEIAMAMLEIRMT